MCKGKRKAVRQSQISKDVCINFPQKGQWKRDSVPKSSIIKVVKKSRRLRQMVLKLSNGRVVATVVKVLDRLSY
ncbi:UNVERIFIED_CONTAM: hypothetical protein Sindi_2888400 [Sesamum indicum]